MVEDEKGSQHWPMSVHLPPWSELHERVAATMVAQPREDPIRIPRVNRAVLFGSPMMEDLATRILATVTGESWQAAGPVDDPDKHYPFTIAVHRDWLMKPREDLGGEFPRQILPLVLADHNKQKRGCGIVSDSTQIRYSMCIETGDRLQASPAPYVTIRAYRCQVNRPVEMQSAPAAAGENTSNAV